MRRPLVSMVCVTNRPHFADIVRTQYEGQTYAHKELVVVDSSENGGLLEGYADVYAREEPGTWVGPLRNTALQYTHGDFLMWFDDDDWRHPELTSILVENALRYETRMAALRSFFWIDLDGRMERRECPNWPVFAAAIYANDRKMPTFRNKTTRMCKTDSLWLLRIKEKFSGFGALINRADLFAWVNHGTNVFNRSYDTESRRPQEDNPRFMPESRLGLRAHMDEMRRACEFSA